MLSLDFLFFLYSGVTYEEAWTRCVAFLLALAWSSLNRHFVVRFSFVVAVPARAIMFPFGRLPWLVRFL